MKRVTTLTRIVSRDVDQMLDCYCHVHSSGSREDRWGNASDCWRDRVGNEWIAITVNLVVITVFQPHKDDGGSLESKFAWEIANQVGASDSCGGRAYVLRAADVEEAASAGIDVTIEKDREVVLSRQQKVGGHGGDGGSGRVIVRCNGDLIVDELVIFRQQLFVGVGDETRFGPELL